MSMSIKRFAGLILILALTACQQATLEPSPLPSPALRQIQITPSLNWLRQTMSDCIKQQSNVHLAVIEKPAAKIDPTQADIVLRWGISEVTDKNTILLGWDSLAVIVNPDNPVENITLQNLITIFSGQQQEWANITGSSKTIELWIYSEQDDIQGNFSSLTGTKMFSQSAYLAPDAAAVLEAVASHPSAIGFVPAHWLTSTVKTLKLDDIPADKNRFPILAITAADPGPIDQKWLNCMQGSIKQ